MLLSKSCEYGLRAALYIAILRPEGYISIREVSDELGISFHFLTKILQKLTGAGIMHSFRGPNGGVALTRPAGEVTLLDVVLAIDGPSLFTECVLGLPGCGNRTPCPLHEGWAEERARLRDMFATTSLARMAERIERLDLRLKEWQAA